MTPGGWKAVEPVFPGSGNIGKGTGREPRRQLSGAQGDTRGTRDTPQPLTQAADSGRGPGRITPVPPPQEVVPSRAGSKGSRARAPRGPRAVSPGSGGRSANPWEGERGWLGPRIPPPAFAVLRPGSRHLGC